ncbi:hypothetical protein [Rufibacter tibetensis]|uniref:Uncharacterized protein n=1 Tax=Rufibacter tibetensis TaxID=512763 RepID=A0A0P0C778_9BACT|nr:hypothetical protein [Rufibacter tibetensis]ALJ00902.1 hypothetical protein DC20_20310 [Rufibacter tibetensis]
MENNTALNTLQSLVGELEFQPTKPLKSTEALSIISKAKHVLQEIESIENNGTLLKQISKTSRELDKAENLIKMDTTLVGGRIAFSALSEFLKKMKSALPKED